MAATYVPMYEMRSSEVEHWSGGTPTRYRMTVGTNELMDTGFLLGFVAVGWVLLVLLIPSRKGETKRAVWGQLPCHHEANYALC